MSDRTSADHELEALKAIIAALQNLDADTRKRIYESAATFLEIDGNRRNLSTSASVDQALPNSPSPEYPPFSGDRSPSPKEFILEKQPKTDVERIAVLAFYLTHYRDMPHFKTLDLSKLNTEAAMPKFANAASSANNALKRRYLVQATKGQRQLSAAGEQFVSALPDREMARAAMAASAPRRTARKSTAIRKANATRKVAETAN
jgi:hypothetical protein